jgi:hypothetical protein
MISLGLEKVDLNKVLAILIVWMHNCSLNKVEWVSENM